MVYGYSPNKQCNTFDTHEVLEVLKFNTKVEAQNSITREYKELQLGLADTELFAFIEETPYKYIVIYHIPNQSDSYRADKHYKYVLQEDGSLVPQHKSTNAKKYISREYAVRDAHLIGILRDCYDVEPITEEF